MAPRNGRRNTTTPNKILAREKQRRALELRKFGMSYAEIARQVHYSNAQAAGNAIRRALKELPKDEALDLRQLNLERLNQWMLTLWPKTIAGDENAIRTSLMIMERMDRLKGTEAAQQHHVGGTIDHNVGGVLVIEGGSEEYMDKLKQMAAAGGIAPPPAIMGEDGKYRDEQGNEVILHDAVAVGDEDLDIVEAELVAQEDDDIVIPVPVPELEPAQKPPRKPPTKKKTAVASEEQPSCSAFLIPSTVDSNDPVCRRCNQPRSVHNKKG